MATPPKPSIPGPGLPTITVRPLQDKISAQLEQEYKKRLNVAELPSDMKAAIKAASENTAQRATQRNLEVEAQKIARSFYQPASIDVLIGSKLSQAVAGVQLVSQSADLGAILTENAKMLRKKWKALVDAGFTEDQSFELIKAEVEGKAARRGPA